MPFHRVGWVLNTWVEGGLELMGLPGQFKINAYQARSHRSLRPGKAFRFLCHDRQDHTHHGYGLVKDSVFGFEFTTKQVGLASLTVHQSLITVQENEVIIKVYG